MRKLTISLLLPIVLLAAAPAFASPPPQSKADQILVFKKDRTLQLLRQGKVIKEYKIALGTNPVGPKHRQGDGKTPEGVYLIDRHNPQSQFYKSLHISYPNAQDRALAKKQGFAPGGDVFLHGLGKKWGWVGAGHRLHDWTLGCIAVTNEEIDEIWNLVPDGTPIDIRP